MLTNYEYVRLYFIGFFLFAEKVIYFLLLDRKKRKPAYEDDTEIIVRSRCGSQVRREVTTP